MAHSIKDPKRNKDPIEVHFINDSKVDERMHSLSEIVIKNAEAKFKINRQDNIIADRISKMEVLNYFDIRRVGFRYSFIPKDEIYGKLIILEWIKSIHEAVSGEILLIITESVGGRGNLINIGRSNSIIGGVIKNSNGGVRPRGLRPDNVHILSDTSDGNAFPNIVWEVKRR
jgi:hypothetical protein